MTKGDLVTDSHSVLARWRNHLFQLFGVQEADSNTYSRTTSAFEFQMAVEKLKGHKSPGTDQIPAELIKAGGRTIRYEIHTYYFYLE